MTKDEIKKELYKQKPIAQLKYIHNAVAHYCTFLNHKDIWFKVPVSDMQETQFYYEEDAKLLIRWLVVKPNEF